MPSKFSSLTVTWYDESDGYITNSAITSDVIQIPLFTDTGSGEVNEAEITISAKGGKYISSGSVIFDKFDRIRIQITDLGSNSYDRYFEITDILPGQTKENGSIITLSCLGIEYHTQVIHYSRRDWYENAFDIANNIGETYQDNNGSRQPTLQRHDIVYSTSNKYGNELPGWTNNHYEFGTNEENCYNRWMDVIDLLGGGVGTGGVGDFFELGFDTPSVNVIDMAIFVSGARTFDGNNPSNDSSAVVIENTTTINVSQQEGGVSNPTGTKVAAWGSPTHGSLPLGTAKYRANELEFIFRPEWETGVPYKAGAKVIDVATNKHYVCPVNKDHTSGTFSTDLAAGKWSIIDMGSEFGDTVQYSEWTDDKAKLWANAGANPDAVSSTPAHSTSSVSYTIGDLVSFSSKKYVAVKNHTSSTSNEPTDGTGDWEEVDNELVGNGAAFFDCNIVVKDDGIMFRTWVNEVIGDTDYDSITDQAPSNEYLHSPPSGHSPLNHRFLNVSNTSLSGVDTRGRNFDDAVVQWDNERKQGDNGLYFVIYEQPTSVNDKTQVFDIKDRKIWEWDNSSSKWLDVTTSSGRNDDCAHEWKSVYNIASFDPRPTKQSTTPFNEGASDYSTNIRSAVEVCYAFGIVDQIKSLTAVDTKKGAWLTFGFPFPVSTYNSISEGVGDIYGAGTNEQSTTEVTRPSTIDTQNMTWTSDGKTGFNHTTSEELGPLSSLSYNMKIVINDKGIGTTPLGGTVIVRCALHDVKDNVVVQDYEIRFTDGKSWQTVNLPLSGFTIYRGREPKNHLKRFGAVGGIEIPIQELDIQDVFEFRHIKYITFQIQDFYDDEGRYDPFNDLLDVTNTGAFTAEGGYIRMAIDSLHFKKRLLAITGQPSVQNIEPKFMQRPNIISQIQLLNEAKSQLEIEQFRHKEFNFQTSGNNIFDIRFGDTFFLKNTDLINDNNYTETNLGDGDGTAGTIRLVAKRIEYHLTVPESGPGGITRSIKSVKRYVI